LASTIDASRLMGAGVIVTGLSAEIAQTTLVAIGAEIISKLNTAGDLQGGIEEPEHLLGLTLVPTSARHADAPTWAPSA
jgi:rsbT co-antagonist protein RsbR